MLNARLGQVGVGKGGKKAEKAKVLFLEEAQEHRSTGVKPWDVLETSKTFLLLAGNNESISR
jgi:hypothetical protein